MPIRKALRPGAGSDSSASRSSTPPVDAVDVSISGDWPVTVIDLLERADFEHDVERDELLRRDDEALALVGLVAGELRLQRVGAGRDRRESCTARRRW